MHNDRITIEYTSYADVSELDPSDRSLIEHARTIASTAYAPYSRFRVGAVAELTDGSRVTGTNQENASYPVGLCAERVLLAALSSIAPNGVISKMAISYESDAVASNEPVAPCGICRQSLVEYETRNGSPMRLILSGSAGTVMIFNSTLELLPLAFHPAHLGR